MFESKNRGRTWFLLFCVSMSAVWLVAWVYNIYITAADIAAGATRFHAAADLAWYEWVAVDQTTFSTFMMWLVFSLPLSVAWYPKLFPGRETPVWVQRGF